LFRGPNFKTVCDSIFFASPPVSIIRFGNFSFEVRQFEAEIDPGILWLA